MPSIVLTLIFYVILMDPAGILNLKFPSLVLLIISFFLLNSRNRIPIENIMFSLSMCIFSVFFLLKQEIFFENNQISYVVAQSLFLFGVFLILANNGLYLNCLYRAVQLLLITNLIFIFLGAYFPTLAIATNIALKPYKMFSLEMRDHHFLQYAFYHNSVYAGVVYVPRLLSEIRSSYSNFYSKSICLICLLSLILTQSRSVYLGLFLIFIFMYWRFFVVMTPFVIFGFVSFMAQFSALIVDTSTSTKIDYLSVFYEQFDEGVNVFLGTGPLLVNWGGSVGSVNIIELTYFEIFRYFGAVGFLFLFILALYLCIRSYAKSRVYGIGVVAYFGMCFVNPYIWGLTGLPLLSFPLLYSYKR